MLPPDKSVNAVAEQTVASGQDLLQQALALFDLQHIQPVTLAFPAVISEKGVMSAEQLRQDVGQLFAQQELLFAAMEAPEAAPQTEPAPPGEAGPAAAAPAESAELQAIRQMYADD